MITYPKIQSLFKRDSKGRFIDMKWTMPVFEYLSLMSWTAQEKIDGTNIRLGFRHTENDIIQNVYKEVYEEDNTVMYIGGRTNNAKLQQDLLKNLKPIGRRIYAYIMDNFGGVSPDLPITYYGEGFGAGIQKVGRQYLDYKDFCLFDIRLGNNIWLPQSKVKAIAEELDIMYPKIVFDDWNLYALIEYMMECERDKDSIPRSAFGDAPSEGVILRPPVELQSHGARVISKVKFVDKWWDSN